MKTEVLLSKDKHSRIRLKMAVDMCVKPDKSKPCFIHGDFSCVCTCCPRRAKWTTLSALFGGYI